MPNVKPKVEVLNEEEIPAEVIASAIVDVAKAMKKVDSSRLQRKTIVELIHAQSKLPKRDIVIVLNNLEALERDWLKPKK